jgi:hypothetical protein
MKSTDDKIYSYKNDISKLQIKKENKKPNE